MPDDTPLAALVLASGIAAGTPLLLAGVGETLAQRSGVINLGLEGAMLLGAVVGVHVVLLTGNFPLAFCAAAVAGAFLGSILSLLREIVGIGTLAAGLCLFFVGGGVSAFAGHSVVGRPIPEMGRWEIPILCDLPFVGPALFRHDAVVYSALLLAAAAWFLLFRTRWGLSIRACGESAEAASNAGIQVRRVRAACVAGGAALAGVGGAYLAFAFARGWLEGVTGGRGWIAIGLVIIARWNPLYTVPAAWLFGLVAAMQFQSQAAGIRTSPYLLSALPYVLAVLAMIAAGLFARGGGAPAELRRIRT